MRAGRYRRCARAVPRIADAQTGLLVRSSRDRQGVAYARPLGRRPEGVRTVTHLGSGEDPRPKPCGSVCMPIWICSGAPTKSAVRRTEQPSDRLSPCSARVAVVICAGEAETVCRSRGMHPAVLEELERKHQTDSPTMQGYHLMRARVLPKKGYGGGAAGVQVGVGVLVAADARCGVRPDCPHISCARRMSRAGCG